jgi:ribose 5-phosphate isomerase B
MSNIRIAIASDHAGYNLKEQLVDFLLKNNYTIEDLGTHSLSSVDYPDYGHALAEHISQFSSDIGISICGSGNGINITANKHVHIRSALCWKAEIAELARRHNDANICALPARFISFQEACDIVRVFIETPFDGGRHCIRVEKIPIKK